MVTWTRNALAAGWLVLAACNGGQTGDESTPDVDGCVCGMRDAGPIGDDAFLDSLRPGLGNYDAAESIWHLAERSDVIAVGTIVSVRAGEEDDAPSGNGRGVRISGLSTAVVELALSQVLKGEPAERIHVQFYTGHVFDAARLPDPLPDNRLLLFLHVIADGDDDAGAVSPGVPEGEPLYSLTTPQGMVVEDDSGEADIQDPIYPRGSFASLIDTVQAMLRARQ
jgi:hypothetical protein